MSLTTENFLKIRDNIKSNYGIEENVMVRNKVLNSL